MYGVKDSPCAECPRNEETGCTCGKWRAWFKEVWRELQDLYLGEEEEK